MGIAVDRRSVLIGAALLPLAACTADPTPPPPPPPDPDGPLRSAAVDRERDLLERYDAVLLAVPALAARLAPVRREHAEHLRALLPGGAAAGPTASPSPSAPPPAPGPVPEPAAALAALSAAEGAAGGAHASAALQAAPELAGLLASLAASEASHRVVLA